MDLSIKIGVLEAQIALLLDRVEALEEALDEGVAFEDEIGAPLPDEDCMCPSCKRTRWPES